MVWKLITRMMNKHYFGDSEIKNNYFDDKEPYELSDQKIMELLKENNCNQLIRVVEDYDYYL